jgi:autotransporter-associated beta strand protein
VPTVFDLNGYNQTLAGLNTSPTPADLGWVTNSSATAATLTLSNSAQQIFGGSIVGNLAVNIVNGTQVYSNSTTADNGVYAYTGDTTITNGTLKFGATGLLPNGTGKGNLIVTNAGTLDLNTYSQTINGLYGNGTIDTVAGGSPALTVGNANVNSFFSGLVKNTAGALTLTVTNANAILTLAGANNTFSGGVNIGNGAQYFRSGVVRAAATQTLGTGTIIVGNGGNESIGRLELSNSITLNNYISLPERSGTNVSIENLNGNNTLSGTLGLTSGGSFAIVQSDAGFLTLGTSGSTAVSNQVTASSRIITLSGVSNGAVAGNIVDTGSAIVGVTKDGSGTWALSGADAYSGDTRITNGTLVVSNTLALQNSSVDMNVLDSGTLNLNNLNATLGGLKGARSLALGTGTISVGNNNVGTNIYSGQLSGNALMKIGSATWTLTGNNLHTGATTVSAGELIGQTGSSCSNSAVTVSSGGTNGVLVATAGGQWVCGGLTYSSGSTYADFNFNGNLPSTTTAPLLINGNLAFTVAPTVIVRPGAMLIPPGTYPLFKYSGTLSGTVPTTLILPGGMVATLVNNTVNQSLDLNVTLANQLFWVGGVNTNWDTTTLNWKNGGGTITNYVDGAAVIFDDTSTTNTINIVGTVTPASVTFSNNVQNYAITNGVIAGSGSLIKNGTAALSLTNNANTYTGVTVLNGGTLALGGATPLGIGGVFTNNNGTTVQFYAPTIANNIVVPTGATVSWVKNAPGGPTLSGNLSGGGTINESGNINPALTFSGDDSGFTGVMNSAASGSNDRWRFNSATAGSANAAWSLNNNATDGYGFNFATGTIYFGSLSGSGTFRNDLAGTVTLSVGALNTSTTFSGIIIANSTSILALTKTGTGTLTLTGANTYTGATTITGGRLAVTPANLTGAGPMIVNDNGRLNLTAVGSVSQLSVSTLTLGSANGCTNEFAAVGNTTTAPMFATTLTLAGTNVINIISGAFTAGYIYPLIGYTTINGAGSFQIGTVPTGLVATITTNNISGVNTIALNVSAANTTVDVWSGKTSGNWDTSTAGNWTNSGAAVIYADNDNVRFDDSASAFTVTAASGANPYLSPGNFVVSNTANAYTLGGSSITINSLTKSGTNSLTVTAAEVGSGPINLNSGTINLNGPSFGVMLGSGPLNFNGGTLSSTIAAANTTDLNNPIYVATGMTGTINMGTRIQLGSASVGYSLTGAGTLNLNAQTTVSRNDVYMNFSAFTGAINFTGSGGVRLFNNGGYFGGFGTATVDIEGSVSLQPQSYSTGGSWSIGALSGSSFGASISGSTAGAITNSIGANNASTTFAGSIQGNSVITKVGSGTLTLSGTNTYSGSTTVSAGALIGVTGGYCSNSAVTINTGATNGVFVSTQGGQWSCSNLTYSAGTEYASFTFTTNSPSTTTAPMLVLSNLTISGTLNILVSGYTLSLGTYPLLTYAGTLTGAPVLTPLALPQRDAGYITNNTTTRRHRSR